MKSQQLEEMLRGWESLAIDARLACATAIVETERDCVRLRQNVLSRGINVFLLDLPLLDDLLLSLLENGKIAFVGPLTARRSKKDQRPRFLWSFWSRVCDVDGCLLEEPDPNALMSIRMLASHFKKLQIACSPSRIEDAVREFHEIEEQIDLPVLNWSDDSIDVSRAPTFSESFRHYEDVSDVPYRWNQFLHRLDRVAAILVTGLPMFDSMSGNERREDGYFRHGRGVVSNLRRGQYKYRFPSWSDKLEGTFPFDWCSGQPLGSYPPTRQEPPAKLAAVPKTAKGPRLIASEPVEHQWCQQKLFTWLDYHMSGSLIGRFVDLHDQLKSQVMVTSASLDRSLCTIDLSSASDRISCRHIESLFRSNPSLLDAMHAVRSRYWRDGVISKRVFVTRKFTTMGSTLTFPVQCIFFLSVVLASAGAHDLRSVKNLIGKVRVFGDDIIAPNHAYAEIAMNLTTLGLKVNTKKSFHRGEFRESCGKDSWRGFDITPVKPKAISPSTPESHQAVLDTSNNLYKKGWWHASEHYRRLLPSAMTENVFRVASEDEGVLGLLSYSGSKIINKRWCNRLHMWYTRVLALKKPLKRVAQDHPASLSEHFTRAYSGLNPRKLGVAEQTTARLGLVRVAL